LPFSPVGTRVTEANPIEHSLMNQEIPGFFCKKCNYIVNCNKKTTIWKFPDIIVIKVSSPKSEIIIRNLSNSQEANGSFLQDSMLLNYLDKDSPEKSKTFINC